MVIANSRLILSVGSGQSYSIHSPATGELVGSVESTTLDDLENVITAARAAWPRWVETPIVRRAALLASCAQAIRERSAEISSLLTYEQGKPLKESQIEVSRCADTFEYYAGVTSQTAVRDVRVLPGKRAWVERRPVGVVAAVVPWNFPLTLLANKLVPALLMGNSVVVKPAPTTPLATSIVLSILNEVGIPSGLVGYVVGDNVLGASLVSHPNVDLVSFTGSTATGRAIMAAAAPTVKRLTLELGGSDPMIVCDDADIEGAAKSTAIGRFFNCGQACIAIKRVYVMDKVFDDFLERLVTRVRKLEIGDGHQPGIRIGPQHSAAERQRSLGFIEDAVSHGADIIIGGKSPSDPNLQYGNFLLPTVLTGMSDDASILHDECFGPVLPVVRVQSLEEAIQRANHSIFGLGSSIWTNSADRAQVAIDHLFAGYTWVNDIATDYDVLPFGGVKQSGFGRERGMEALDEYVNLKSVVMGETPAEMVLPGDN